MGFLRVMTINAVYIPKDGKTKNESNREQDPQVVLRNQIHTALIASKPRQHSAQEHSRPLYRFFATRHSAHFQRSARSAHGSTRR